MRKDYKERPLAVQKPDGTYGRVISRGRKRSAIVFKEYSYWQNMKTRCTNPNYSEKFPTYKDVTWSDNFSNYNFFVEWCREQPEFFNKGWFLDKDIVKVGNKVYHEDFCVFVPSIVNAFFVVRENNRDKSLPVGVSWCESENKYKAYCSQLDGRNKTLGRFNNPVDAGISYIKFKNSLAKELLKHV